MIVTLEIKLLSGLHMSDDWSAVFEIDAQCVLEDLHTFIQKAVHFDNDHLYEFFIARTERSRDRVSFSDDDGGIYDRTIASLFPLPERKHLYYLFDWGDYWIFKITRSRRPAAQPVRKVKYPRLVKETGTRPQQYPAWDEDGEPG